MQKSFLVMALIGSLAAAPGHATQVGPGYVSQLTPSANGALLFYIVDVNGVMLTRTGLPACAVNQPGRWVVDASDSTGGLMQANALIELWRQHMPITVTGQDLCSIWSDTETVENVSAAY